MNAAQSVGQIPVAEAAQASDIYAFTGHKLACGPEGLGGVAISEHVLTDAQPTVIGWRSLKDETGAVRGDPDPFLHDSPSFEVATSCVPFMAGLRSSLELKENEGGEIYKINRFQQMRKICGKRSITVNE